MNAKLRLSSMQDLKALQRELQLARRLAEEEAERRAAQARLLEQEQRAFELAVGAVTALKPQHRERVEHQRPLPAPEPLQREADERAALLQALSDDFDVDSLLETDETLSFRRPEIGPDTVRKLRRGHWALQAQIDLHGLRRDQAREALGASLQTVPSAACAACAWCMARAMARRAASPCSRAGCDAGWCRRPRCWPLCRPAPATAAAAR